MAHFRILYATTAGIGCFYGSSMDKWTKKTFQVDAQVLDPERPPGSEHNENSQPGSRFTRYGMPQRDVTLTYKHFQMSYDNRNRMPNWVVEHLNYDKLNAPQDGGVCRINYSFKSEPRVKKEFQSDAVDYEAGVQRSTLADYSNYRNSTKGTADCHAWTNGVPQDIQFQTGVWKDLEIYCRYLTQIYDDVYVISGPVFEPMNQNRMQYRVSATNRLAFPSHYYKIIIGKTCDGFHLGAYLLPNQRIPNRELGEFRVPLSVIEKKAGFKLFKSDVNIPETLVNVLDFRQRRQVYMPDEFAMELDPPEDHLNAEGGEQNGQEHNGHLNAEGGEQNGQEHNGHN